MSFEDVRRDWVRLGERDPLWAVYVAADKRGGRWDPEQFLATGRAAVAESVRWLTALGAGPPWGRVLDFGCGAGRLSQALSAHADEVVGVDIAPPMLAVARGLNPPANCTFVLNETSDLARFADGGFDLVYSELVLQHLPPAVIESYLREFVRVLAPDGVALLQCTTRPLWTFKGVVWRLVPGPLVRLAQRWLLRYPAPMRMTRFARVPEVVSAAGGTVLATREVDDSATHWRSTRYVIRGSSRS
ncbi:class I SAM-dependent methyltransferase [Actinophytocola gossypii]|uniref:Class I SAM-dependent methyltransferase n=1 Tax=Actinophytocola gossypii TaxID=2812003 RepID=A0ABT2J4Q8_9PSEU|nr:class I SAM-dependent methyltransferase [Actinophytocola gossypii]MCT2582768.1 class I SAM-dependent methyltransferase [Actinophytocola gossypii]